MKSKDTTKKIKYLLFYGLVTGTLCSTILINYLFFHTFVEIFSIVVAFSSFMIAWNSRSFSKDQFFLFLGIAYFFIALLDLLHTLSYKGMPIFSDRFFYANQLWVVARGMESLSFALAFIFLGTGKSFRPGVVLICFGFLTAGFITSIFFIKVFPVCFVEGEGQTAFKKISEILFCFILLADIILLYKKRDRFNSGIFYTLLISLVFTIFAELAFTFYITNFGISNIIGHFFKLFSFFLIYRALIETGIRSPFRVIFNDLATSNQQLKEEIVARKTAEEEKEKVITELKEALSEIKTLNGLLPICSYCKKVRDDQGYWKQIEAYISEHSDARFSHSICQDCLDKYFPDMDIKESDK